EPIVDLAHDDLRVGCGGVDGQLEVARVVDRQRFQRVLPQPDEGPSVGEEVTALAGVDVALVAVPVRAVVLDGQAHLVGLQGYVHAPGPPVADAHGRPGAGGPEDAGGGLVVVDLDA